MHLSRLLAAELQMLNVLHILMQVAVDVDAVKWSLCHERTPFFASALSGLKLAMTHNEDNSGAHDNYVYESHPYCRHLSESGLPAVSAAHMPLEHAHRLQL